MEHFIKNAQEVLQAVEKRLNDSASLPFGIKASSKAFLLALGSMGLISYAIMKYFIYRLYFHPLRRLPGPRTGWIPLLGNMPEALSEASCSAYKEWAHKYGGLVCFHGPLNNPRIMISDPELLKQVLTTQHYRFTKSPIGTALAKAISGDGLISVEGEVHRQQRKMLNPAFSIKELRDLTPLLFVPALQLAHKWMGEIDRKRENDDESVDIIVSQGASYMTMDMIGLSAFGQEFNAVRYHGTEKVSKITRAYETIFDRNHRSVADLLGLVFPILRHIPTKRNQEISKALKDIHEESRIIVKRCIARTKTKEGSAESHMLATLIRQSDASVDNGFTEEEIRVQSLTFLAAGAESAATTITWCLWYLAKHQDIQDALRAEVVPIFRQINENHPVFHKNPFEVGFDGANIPSYEDINRLHLLENVVRETFRVMPTAPFTTRVVAEDVILKGHLIPKGTNIVIPIIVNHHDKAVWGQDAEEFRPSRWNEEPATSTGPYNYMPFLSGGRQCIGNRLAMMKIKVALGILLTRFQFFEKPGFHFTTQMNLTLSPVPNMTLLVRPVNQ